MKREYKSKKEESSVTTLVLILLGLLLISSTSVSSDTPTPHPVLGRVFSDGGNGVPNGVPVLLNNTNQSKTLTLVEVSAPPIPQFAGSYSASIEGENNDTVLGVSWNATHYGENVTNLSATSTRLNIVLDQQRPAEPNVTIIIPTNNTVFNVTTEFNLTANITMLGANAFNCYANISFSNNVVGLSPGEPDFYLEESISLGGSAIVVWDLTPVYDGSLNISVRVACQGEERRFETPFFTTAGNITITDLVEPNVTLVGPDNDSFFNAIDNVSQITFEYNVTDHTPIANCSLYINSTINVTNTSINRSQNEFFVQEMNPGYYNWTVGCVDNASAHNSFIAPSRFFTVRGAIAPSVTTISLTTPIDLNPGGTSLIFCNATIRDDNNISDVKRVNATFYQQSTGTFAADDNNDHYSNASCVALENGTFESNYSCSMSLHYYATNGTWECNVTVADQTNQTGFLTTTGEVNQLLAFNVSPSFIDYGVLGVLNTTQDPINMTIVNLGNVDFNISLDGYGQTDGDGLAMVCERGSIPSTNQKYTINSSRTFGNMTSLSDTPTVVANFSLPHRTNDQDFGQSKNATYWRIQIPLSTKGSCNGTVIFRTYIG